MTAVELSKKLLKKEISARELSGEYIARAENKNPHLQAYITLCCEKAMEQAEKADMLFAEGSANFMTGLCIGVKDNICTEKIRTTCASNMLSKYVPTYDATVVKKIKQNRGIIIGKTDLDEFGMGAFGENSAFGQCKNPINEEYPPGGSSSGSAAAVTAGLCTWAIGSDTGGSARLPASFCGCVGFKPTYGAISRFGLISYASSMDTVGIITKTAADAAMLSPFLFGKDQKDMTSCNVRCEVDVLYNLSGITFTFSEKDMEASEPFIQERLLECAKTLERLGAKRLCRSVFSKQKHDESYNIISCAEAMSNLARYDGIKYGGDGSNVLKTRDIFFGAEVARRIEFGNFVLKSENYDDFYAAAEAVRKKTSEEIHSLLSEADIVLSPLCDFGVPKLGKTDALHPDKYTVAANFAGIPAISIPYGKDKNGMPVSVQLMAGKRRDFLLLRIAELLEREVAR